MAVLGVWGLARDSAMGNDEVATRYAALLPLHLLARLLRHVDAVHGLYYLLMHGWMAVGTSPAVMRIPSVIAMTAAAALVAIIGRRLTGSGWAAPVRGPDHGAHPHDQLLRADRPLLRAGVRVRGGRHPGTAARAGRGAGGRAPAGPGGRVPGGAAGCWRAGWPTPC